MLSTTFEMILKPLLFTAKAHAAYGRFCQVCTLQASEPPSLRWILPGGHTPRSLPQWDGHLGDDDYRTESATQSPLSSIKIPPSRQRTTTTGMISNRLLGGKAIVMEMGSKVTFCKFHWNLTRKDQLSFKTSFLVSLSSTTSPNSMELVHYDTGTGHTRGPFQSVITYPQCSPSGTGRTQSGTSR